MDTITNSALKVLIVEEDEYFALHLASLIHAIGYQVVPPIDNQTEALSAIATFLPDLVVMGLDSPEKQLLFNYAQSLKNRTPPILFISNFNKKNFYSDQKVVLKIDEENIRKVIKNKVATLTTNQRIGNNIFTYKGFLFFAKRGIYDKVNIEDILYFKAVDDYALIHTTEKIVTIFTGLKELKALFKADLFVQIHRSYLLNAQKDIVVDFNTNHIHINRVHIIPISRRLKKEVLGWFKQQNILLPLKS